MLNKKTFTTFATHLSPDGGIGRRAGLKHQWGNPSRFDPGSGYAEILVEHIYGGFLLSRPQNWSPHATHTPHLNRLGSQNRQHHRHIDINKV